jgi:DUF2950 family protein
MVPDGAATTTSTSTTTTISTTIPTGRISKVAIGTRYLAVIGVTGSTTRNTAVGRLIRTGRPQINTAALPEETPCLHDRVMPVKIKDALANPVPAIAPAGAQVIAAPAKVMSVATAVRAVVAKPETAAAEGAVIESAIRASLAIPGLRAGVPLAAVEVIAPQHVPAVPVDHRVWVVPAAVVGRAVVDDGGKATPCEATMTMKIYDLIWWKVAFCAFGIVLTALLCNGQAGAAQAQKAFAPVLPQIGFDSPQLAAAALIRSLADSDQDSLKLILGPGSDDLVSTGDPVQDKKRIADFLEKANQKQSFEKEKLEATLLVGDDEWPLPIPIVKYKGKWYFNSQAGREEILARRIGANELDAIAICRGYVDAQREYSVQMHDGVNQYAQRIISSPGKQDGLYWQNADGTPAGPISEGIARAIEEGYSTEKQAPYHGYFFKILKGQGPAAPLGEIDFVINGVMIGGFALVATPAEYGVTGIKTFIVSHDGVVYQKDFGADSLKTFTAMERYDPDKTWTRTNDAWPAPSVTASVSQPK